MSKKPLFTPAPWVSRTDPCHFDTLSTVLGGAEHKRGFGGRVTPELHVEVGGSAHVATQEANTRLISAAPELLQQLLNSSGMLFALAESLGLDGETAIEAESLGRSYSVSLKELLAENNSVVAKALGRPELGVGIAPDCRLTVDGEEVVP